MGVFQKELLELRALGVGAKLPDRLGICGLGEQRKLLQELACHGRPDVHVLLEQLPNFQHRGNLRGLAVDDVHGDQALGLEPGEFQEAVDLPGVVAGQDGQVAPSGVGHSGALQIEVQEVRGAGIVHRGGQSVLRVQVDEVVARRARPQQLPLGAERQGELVRWRSGLIDGLPRAPQGAHEALRPGVEGGHVLLRDALPGQHGGGQAGRAKLLEPPVQVLRGLVEQRVRRRAQPADGELHVLQEAIGQVGVPKLVPELRRVVRECPLPIRGAHHQNVGLLGQISEVVGVHRHAPDLGTRLAALVLLLELPRSASRRPALRPEQHQHPRASGVLLAVRGVRRDRHHGLHPVLVPRVEHPVRHWAAGPLQEVRVQLLHSLVLVGLPDLRAGVQAVDRLHPPVQHIRVVAAGLASSPDAPRGARHHLNEVVGLLFVLDPVHDLVDILAPACNADVDVGAPNLNGRFLDSVKASAGVEVKLGQGLARDGLVGGTQGSLHHTTSDPKQRRRSGGAPERIVIGGILDRVPVLDALHPEELRELPCGEDGIHVTFAVLQQLAAVDLVLLGHTGHHAHRENILRVDGELLRPVRLDGGTHHHLGRAASREVGNELGIPLLNQVNPGRAARRKHGEGPTILQALQKLRALFHDGQVRGEVRVEDVRESRGMGRAHQLPCRDGAWGGPKQLGNGDAGCRGTLENHNLLSLLGLQDVLNVVLFHNGTRGAENCALPAEDAVRLGEILPIVSGGVLEALILHAGLQDVHALLVRARPHTPSAGDAEVVVADDGGGALIHK
eukprot:RCo029412